MYENFVAIFSREGTDVEKTKAFFLEHGAEEVRVLDDYIVIDDDPSKAISFAVFGMSWSKAFGVRLEMGLKRDTRLPQSHYVCLE